MRRFICIGMAIVVMVVFIAAGNATSQPSNANAKAIYQELLKEVDKNGDGKISKEEYNKIWKNERVAEQNFLKYDLNKDGYITEAEYVKVAYGR